MTSEETDHRRRVALARVTKAVEQLYDANVADFADKLRELLDASHTARSVLDDWPRNTRLAGHGCEERGVP